MKLKNYFQLSILFLVIISTIFFGFTGENEKKRFHLDKSYLYESYPLNINRIYLPFNNNGVFGDIITPQGNGGKYDNIDFLFSGGFLMAGYIYPGEFKQQVWANGVITTYRIVDYQPGTIGMSPDDERAKIYILKSSDPHFSQSWQEWKKAVELGAEFYDGDNDGIYNPVDKNNNGIWDYDEDRPNLIGDFTAWFVYNDGVPKEERRMYSEPLGVEIQQTIWAYSSINKLSNSIFTRYKITFKGSPNFPDLIKLDSVVFSFVNDFDLGNYLDDLAGTDTLLKSMNCYNQLDDRDFGNNPPAIFSQLLQGPQVSIPGVTFIDNNGNKIFDTGDTPLTSARSFINPMDIKIIPGSMNLELSSTNARFANEAITDWTPYTVWYFLNALSPSGEIRNPCTFTYGQVVGGVNCNQVNHKFIFSGDPISNRGWINTTPFDVVTFLNTGQFTLEKDKPVDIIVAYSIGRGVNSLNSIEVARENAKNALLFNKKNFAAMRDIPPFNIKYRSYDDRIDLIWETWKDFQFKDLILLDTDTLINLEFEQYELWAHRNSEIYYGPDTTRSKLIASFDVENDIENLFSIDYDGISIKQIFEKGIQLNKQAYSNPERGTIIFSVEKNPFTGKKLSKGEILFFSLKKLFINKTSDDFSVIKNRPKNYLIISSPDYGLRTLSSSLLEIRVGEDLNDLLLINIKPDAGAQNVSESKVTFEEVFRDKLTDDEYEVSFFKDVSSLTKYSMYWRVKNITKNQIVLDSQKVYYNLDTVPVIVDGFYPKIEWIEPEIKTISYSPESNKWFRPFKTKVSGIFYMGNESVKNSDQELSAFATLSTRKSNITKFDHLRRIEIRFGKSQYAYRFVSNSLGSQYISAAGVTSGIGQPGEYFVEVPFQVWVKDDRYKEERQLACAFLETRPNLGGNPDGIWNPDTSILNTKEYIVIFNQSYDSLGRQFEYVGYLPTTGTRVYANLAGWNPPTQAGFSQEKINIAKSPWFDALLIVGLEKIDANATFNDGDVLTIPISYVLTERDKFYYKSTSRPKKQTAEEVKDRLAKVNVFPNPYFEWQDFRNYKSGVITFTNLPEEVTIKIYTLSGNLVKTLTENDKSTITSPFIEWDLRNESGNRVGDGVYLALVKTKHGEKVLKFSIVKQKR